MELLNILILVGAIQGFICSILLFRSAKGKPVSNRLLGSLLFVLSLACLNIFLMLTGFRYRSPFHSVFADVFPLLIVMPVGPLIYFYSKSLVQDDFRIDHVFKYHFFPVAIDLVPYGAGIVMTIGAANALLSGTDATAIRNFIDVYQVEADMLRWTSVTLYVYLSWKLLPTRSGAKSLSTKWLSPLVFVLWAFQAIWLIHLLPYLVPVYREAVLQWVSWYPIYIPLSVLVYWLGLNGYLRNHQTHEFPALRMRNESSTLAPAIMEKIKNQLTNSMVTHRLFLDPELTVEKLGKTLSVPGKNVSATLNQFIGKSFNEFVNEYRVEELKRRLVQEGNEHLTIMGLGLECGFNSQATMQRAFKSLTGKTPSAYLSDLLNIIDTGKSGVKQHSNPDLNGIAGNR